MRLYVVLLPFLFFGQSNLWSWQPTKTMTKQEIKEQMLLKQQRLEVLLKEHNLTASTAFTTEQLGILQEAYKVLGLDATVLIKKKTFVEELSYYAMDFASALMGVGRLDAPIIPSKLKEQLKVVLGESIYLINDYMYEVIVSVLPTEVATRGEVIQKVAHKLKSFTKDYVIQLYKEDKALRKELKQSKSLSKILLSKENVIGAFTNEGIEDKSNKEHPQYKELETSYTDNVLKWLKSTVDSLRRYEQIGKVDISILKGEINSSLIDDQYDAFVKFEFVKVINTCLSEMNESEPRVSDVIAQFITEFKSIDRKRITTYFNYQRYKNYKESNFNIMVGTVLPFDGFFLTAFKEAAKEKVNNDPEYIAFREKYQKWAEKIIESIYSIEQKDTLFHRPYIMVNSKNIGSSNKIASNISSYVYDLANKSEKGTLLKELIAKIGGQISRLAGKPDEDVFEGWKEQQYSFPLDYPKQLKSLLEESMAK